MDSQQYRQYQFKRLRAWIKRPTVTMDLRLAAYVHGWIRTPSLLLPPFLFPPDDQGEWPRFMTVVEARGQIRMGAPVDDFGPVAGRYASTCRPGNMRRLSDWYRNQYAREYHDTILREFSDLADTPLLCDDTCVMIQM